MQSRKELIIISQSCLIKCNRIATMSGTSKMWYSNFKSYVYIKHLTFQLNLLIKMIECLNRNEYYDFLDFLSESEFNQSKITGAIGANRHYIKPCAVKKNKHIITERLVIIYCALSTYLENIKQ